MPFSECTVDDAQAIYERLADERERMRLEGINLGPPPNAGAIAASIDAGDIIIRWTGADAFTDSFRIIYWWHRESIDVSPIMGSPPGTMRNVWLLRDCYGPSSLHARMLVRICRIMVNRGWGDVPIGFDGRYDLPLVKEGKRVAVALTQRTTFGIYVTTANTALTRLASFGIIDLPGFP